MSFLENFAGSFLTGLGNEGMRRADEERQLKLQEALERRRIRMQYEAKYDLEPQAPAPFGAPVQRGPGNWVQQTKVPTRAQFDDENRIIQPSLMQEGPEYTVPDPYALDPKDAAMQDYRERQLAQQKELSEARTAALAERRSSGAREPKIREFGDRPWQLNEETGQWEPMAGPPPKSETGGGDSGKEYRAALERERTRAATYVNKQLEPYAKMDEAKALADIYKRTGIRAPSLSAYRENQIQAAMAPWLEANPAPTAGAKGIPAPAGAKPGDQVRQKSTKKLFHVQADGTMVEV